nr:hypothetical protein CFP56_34447 [Quercus suber]
MEKSRAPPAVGGRGAGSLAVYGKQLSRFSCPSGSGANPTSSVGPKSPSKFASDVKPCGRPCHSYNQNYSSFLSRVLWRCAHDSIGVKVCLARRGVVDEELCPICQGELESVLYALRDYAWVKVVWI